MAERTRGGTLSSSDLRWTAGREREAEVVTRRSLHVIDDAERYLRTRTSAALTPSIVRDGGPNVRLVVGE